ncbi:RsmB/NOP family class I SAM-dependent RNA methyltransferase [Cellulomonas chengniuliangii]|uniref:rRNA small subunit methyltransferase B n=1 Tax=Cellulomonas chengniuliangii TaxID=2968084 RepID=A0ABY5L4P2_9CELL|nr:transcription antitermination factor NusB [Cellulomonas chengniuliangii]MCC2308442.1 rRNA small subunit methyltransferase B [Cellulomonas chengniuliangii]MCC2317459.1 rRNA small subunit methyltransferase B [Cellulomonas chengniuliangii]UUI76818.1 rRNA small subunit methyltransferase B [Cellulomonas chengniuliangii]
MSAPAGRGPGSSRRDARGRERGAARADGRGARTASAPSQRRRGADAARTAAFDVLRAVGGSDSYANLVLPPLLRERRIDGRDAGFATELAYGALRLQGRYDAVIEQCAARPVAAIDAPVLDVLRLGAHQLLGMRVPPHAAVSETVGLAREQVGAGAAQFVNAVLRAVSKEPLEVWLERIGDAADPAGEEPLERLAVVESHPTWIVRALREALVAHGRPADEIEALLRADNDAPRVTLVARPGLTSSAEVVAGLPESRPGRWAPTAVVLESGDPASLPAVRRGAVGVQDEGSQLTALALARVPVEGRDERWLDLCAGPGGKAALLAALASERGARLVANEVQPHRARLVERALAALPADAVEAVRVGDGRIVGEQEPGAYDRVLVDAPCTGLGALRRRPEARWRRSPADLAGLGELQRALLGSALEAVRVGGVVAYVTCSPHLVETQLVVKDALRAAARRGLDVEVLDARGPLRDIAPGIDLADRDDAQLWPHVHGTDAMHLTLLRRQG